MFGLNCLFNASGIFPTISLISAPITIKQGTNIRVTGAHKTTPQDKDITAGFKKFACTDGSIIIGISPTKVVTDVIIIGRNLTTPASITASRRFFPLLRTLLI